MLLWWQSFGEIKKCQQCNCSLPKIFSTNNVHHLLPKNKYDDLKFDESFWMLVCSNCHYKWEMFMKGTEIKKRTDLAKQELLEKHYNKEL